MSIQRIIEDSDLRDRLSEAVDRITFINLQDIRDVLIGEYESTLDGRPVESFVLNDPEEDAFEISRRIEAADMILSYLSSDHEHYNFDDVDWWDNESED